MTDMIALDTDEQNDLAGCEAVIERGRQTFAQVGAALAEIRERRLYRDGHDTFESYLSARWDMRPASAYRHIQAAAVVGALSPIGDMPLPATESQARELARVPEEQRADVWAAAVQRNGGQAAPARLVAEVAAESAGLIAHAMPELLDEEPDPAPLPWHASGGPAERLVFEPKRDEDRAPRAVPVEVVAGPEKPTSRDGDEWFTPPKYAESANHVMGGIDLDPASCEAANRIIGADAYYDQEADGLAQPWYGRVYLNPPYSETGAWIDKLASEAGGLVTEAIVLVNAKVEAGWFDRLWEISPVICFVRGRISFVAGDGGKSQTGFYGQAFAYFGPNREAFMAEFRQYGRLVTTAE